MLTTTSAQPVLTIGAEPATYYLSMQPSISGRSGGQYVSATLNFDPSLGTITTNYVAIRQGIIWAANNTPFSPGADSNANQQVRSLGVGTAASGTTGEIRATNEITAYFSDDRLKNKLGKIENALDKICALEGFYYEPNSTAQELGYEMKKNVGISAQKMQEVLPEIVAPAPVDSKYLTVRYERALPLIIEAIKELRQEILEIKRGN